MNPNMPLPPSQSSIDEDHLKLLSIFHYVIAGLAGLYILFLFAHFLFMNVMFSNPQMMDNSGSPPPEELMGMMRGFYVFMGLLVVGSITLNILAARYLRSFRNRKFLFVVSGINCLNMPLGTVLGIFTIIVLVRPTVAQRFPVTSPQ